MQMIIISGPPCSGKTALRERVARHYALPVLGKDDFKELLFDGLGWSDRAWSQKVGGVSYDLLRSMTRELCKTGRPFIVESNFTARFAAAMAEIADQFSYQPLVVHCVAEGSVLFARFRDRAQSGSRHPGHQDRENLAEFEATLNAGPVDPPSLGGPCLTVDTSDFAQVSDTAIFAFLDEYLVPQAE